MATPGNRASGKKEYVAYSRTTGFNTPTVVGITIAIVVEIFTKSNTVIVRVNKILVNIFDCL